MFHLAEPLQYKLLIIRSQEFWIIIRNDKDNMSIIQNLDNTSNATFNIFMEVVYRTEVAK